MTDDRTNDPSSPQGASPAGSTPPGDPAPTSPYDQGSPWSSPPPAPSPEAPSYLQAPPPTPYSQQPDAQQPYGQQPYGQPGAPYQGGYAGAPYPGAPQPYGAFAPEPVAKARSSATLWLVLNIAAVVFWGWLLGGLLGVVGAIFAGIALGETGNDLASATRKIRLAKILFWVSLGIAVLLGVVGVIALIAFANSVDSGDFSRPADV